MHKNWLSGGLATELAGERSGCRKRRIAAISAGSGAGDEERGQPVANVVRDCIHSAVLSVERGALLGKALRRARNVERGTAERAGIEHHFPRGNFGQGKGRV